MKTLLQPGDVLKKENGHGRGSYTIASGAPLIGGGTQGEVYAVTDSEVVIKWYRPEYLPHDPLLRQRLENNIDLRSPNDDFLWPFAIVSANGRNSFGYAMPFKKPRFKSLGEVMNLTPSTRVLARAGFNLAKDFLQLHVGRGLCYRDINLGNIFFDPVTGEVCIADNDNADIEGRPGGLTGTREFMPPEVVTGAAAPSRFSDLHALSVLLFMMFMITHPLVGQRLDLLTPDNDDPGGWKQLFGRNALFVFDPSNHSNRPLPGAHVLNYWPMYPGFLRRLFLRAFTQGLHDPDVRISENEWKKAMVRLGDSVFVCPYCSVGADVAENMFDPDAWLGSNPSQQCWNCHHDIAPPPCLHLRESDSVVVLSEGTQLFGHHLGDLRYDFSKPWAIVVNHPPALKNLSSDTWTSRIEGGQLVPVSPGEAVPLLSPSKINFGRVSGEITIHT